VEVRRPGASEQTSRVGGGSGACERPQSCEGSPNWRDRLWASARSCIGSWSEGLSI
jgi:hypothetical protein